MFSIANLIQFNANVLTHMYSLNLFTY